MLYSKEIFEKFQHNRPMDVLKKHLYDFQQYTEDQDFHFLIGMCMLKMGYLEEAHVAFQKAIVTDKTKNVFRNKLFLAVTLLQAQRYEEAKQIIENIPIEKLSASEIVVVMETKNRLLMNTDIEFEILNKIFESNSNIDNYIFKIFGLFFNGQIQKAEEAIKNINEKELYDLETYFVVIEEFYKLHISQEVINMMIENLNFMKMKPNKVLSFLKTIFGVRYYHTIPQEKRTTITHMIAQKFKKEEDVLVQLYCMNYDIAELQKDGNGMNSAIYSLKKIYLKKKRSQKKDNEQALLYLVTDAFKKFSTTNKKSLKDKIEILINLDQGNIKYRQFYCDLLRNLGYVNEALEVIKSTTAICQLQEKNEFDLIQKFHSFYMPNDTCIFFGSQKHEEHPEECPLCFGSDSKPIIKTIAFGHSPGDVFVENAERKIIEVDERTLKAIVDWQPMNMPSRLVGDYLHYLGAYSTSHDFPKVLAPGQTYIFLKMKTEAYKRLAQEGYSLEQIDPLSNVFMGVQKIKFKEHMDIFNHEGRDFPTGENGKFAVNANDFVLEIIKTTSANNQ